MKEIRLSLKRVEVSVKLEDENGEEQEYILRELVGEDRDEYVDLVSARLTLDKGKVVGIKSQKGLEIRLVSLCLYKDEKRVEQSAVKRWPASTIHAIADEAQAISALSKEDGDKAGNV